MSVDITYGLVDFLKQKYKLSKEEKVLKCVVDLTNKAGTVEFEIYPNTVLTKRLGQEKSHELFRELSEFRELMLNPRCSRVTITLDEGSLPKVECAYIVAPSLIQQKS